MALPWTLAIHGVRVANPVGRPHQSAAGFSPPRNSHSTQPGEFLRFVPEGTPRGSERSFVEGELRSPDKLKHVPRKGQTPGHALGCG